MNLLLLHIRLRDVHHPNCFRIQFRLLIIWPMSVPLGYISLHLYLLDAFSRSCFHSIYFDEFFFSPFSPGSKFLFFIMYIQYFLTYPIPKSRIGNQPVATLVYIVGEGVKTAPRCYPAREMRRLLNLLFISCLYIVGCRCARSRWNQAKHTQRS